MVQSKNKELDVALELFNAELEKQKLKEKELAVVKKAEKKKSDAVKALQQAEKNPNISQEEKDAVKSAWLKADDDLKRILAEKNHKPKKKPKQKNQPAKTLKNHKPKKRLVRVQNNCCLKWLITFS